MAEKSALDRDQAFNAKPVAANIVKREPLDDGGQRLTVRVAPGKWQKRLLRLPDEINRQFDLDSIGVEVLDMCDGNKSVRYIIRKFAKTHKVNEHEAEKAVVAFLRTMMQRGLVMMAVPK